MVDKTSLKFGNLMKENLCDYNFPQDLKKMSDGELELLSYAIREFLIDRVSKTGGHLASNLGVVELTIALHKVFDCPKDKIIWDVGHQAYVHKILTGRASEFDTLRQFEGLSGFPKFEESPCDAFNTGHSSTSISAAAGLAAARDLSGEDNEVIAVIGDGSLTGGMAYEALNNIGASKSKVIVVLNDNGMSISQNIGGISNHLDSLRTSKGYLGVKKFLKDRVANIPSVGKPIVTGLADFKNDIKYSIMDYGGVLFEELGFTYFGPIDGHDIKKLTEAFNRAKSLNEPVLIHVITKKGKGYINAEKAPDKFHGIGAFDVETGEPLNKSKRPSYSSLMGWHLLELARKDDKVVAITAAMGDATGLSAFAKEFPDRFFDVGIAEQHAVTFAAGLAMAGYKPFVCIYSTFLQRAYDQMLHDVCMQNLPVKFMIDRAGIVGADGQTHQGVFDLSYLNSMPNMTVLAPYCDDSLRKSMDYALECDGPCAVRYPRGESVSATACEVAITSKSDQSQSPADFAKSTDVAISGRVLNAKSVDIIAVGKMAETGARVAELLYDKHIMATCHNLTILKPLKPESSDLQKLSGDLIVTIEDNVLTGGFGQSFKNVLEACGDKHDQAYIPYGKPTGKCKEILTFGWPDEFIEQGTFAELADKYGLSAEKIAERICEELERKA